MRHVHLMVGNKIMADGPCQMHCMPRFSVLRFCDGVRHPETSEGLAIPMRDRP